MKLTACEEKMKLLNFVRKHPTHAKWAICILAVGFAASFTSLLVLGFAVCHERFVEKNTNAALVISDTLSLYELGETGEGDAAVFRALIDARVPLCLSREDVRLFKRILNAADGSLETLYTALHTAAAHNQCTASDLASAIRKSATELPLTSRAAEQKESRPKSGRVLKPYDAKKLAESFFEVPFVFRAEGNLSYCGNLCARFNEKNARLIAFSAEWPMVAEENFSPEECKDTAQLFAEQNAGLRVVSIDSARSADGVCWMDIIDYNGWRWKIGVRTDTGSITFFCPLENGKAG